MAYHAAHYTPHSTWQPDPAPRAAPPLSAIKTTILTLATKFSPDEFHALDTASRAGLRGVEFWLDNALLLNWKTTVALARKYSFRYALHFPNEGVLQPEALRGAVCLYGDLECRAMVIHQPMYDRYADDLLTIEPSLHLAVENHDLDVAGFSRWAQQNRWLTLDVEHLWMCTLKDAPLESLLAFLDQFLSQHGKKLRHVHLPGYRGGGEEHLPMHRSAAMATRAIGLLADHGFSELVVSEAHQQYQNFEELRQDVVMFEQWQTKYASQTSPHFSPP